MPGLLTYALAGGLQGYGDGILMEAQQRREDALRAQDRAWEVEDRERAIATRRSSGSGGSGQTGKVHNLTTNEINRIEELLKDRQGDYDPLVSEQVIGHFTSFLSANPGSTFSDAWGAIIPGLDREQIPGEESWLPFGFGDTPASEGGYTGGYTPPAPAAQETPSASPTSNTPQPGDVVDGYRFKGGDPSNQNNWEPVN